MKETRMQFYNHEDTSFEIIRRDLEVGCPVEKRNNEIVRGWKDFYGTLHTFPGYGKLKPAYLSLAYSRDIILDPFNQVPTGSALDTKPESTDEKIKAWKAKIGSIQFHLLYSKSKSRSLYDTAAIAMIGICILEALVIAAGYLMKHSHNTPAATGAILTLSLLGSVLKSKQPEAKSEDKKTEDKKPDSPSAKDLLTIQPRNWRRTIYLSSGIASGFACIGLFILYWFNPMMTMIAMPAVIFGATAFFTLRAGFNSERYTPIIVSKPKKEEPDKPINSVNIYPHEILFEHTENPLGQPHLCRNNRHFYYMHKMAPQKDGTFVAEPFMLPDASYCDPGLFGKTILELPASRRYLKRKVKMGQIISLAILFGVIIIEFIAMIAMG